MARRRVPPGDPRVGELVAAGWLKVSAFERSDWREAARLSGASPAGDERPTPSWTQWDREHLPRPRLVARLQDRIVGWAALAPLSAAVAHAGAALVHIHVDPVVRRCGVGRALLTRVVSEAEALGIWSLQVAILGDDGGGLYLHRRCGFRVIGSRERVALIDGAWVGELLMERRSKVVQPGAEAPQLRPGTPEWDAAREEAVRRLAPIFIEIARQRVVREDHARLIGIPADELDELYRRGERSRAEDDRLIAAMRERELDELTRERRKRWDDEVREEIERRKREGLPYEHILPYFDPPASGAGTRTAQGRRKR
jgi:L-amino acid N-acyltransferase YncA